MSVPQVPIQSQKVVELRGRYVAYLYCVVLLEKDKPSIFIFNTVKYLSFLDRMLVTLGGSSPDNCPQTSRSRQYTCLTIRESDSAVNHDSSPLLSTWTIYFVVKVVLHLLLEVNCYHVVQG